MKILEKRLTFVNIDIVLVVRLLYVGVDPGDLGGGEGLHGTHQAEGGRIIQ